MAQSAVGRQSAGESPSRDRAKLAAFQSGLAAAVARLAAADKAYLTDVRAALQGGALPQAEAALARYDQQVTLAVRAAPPTPAFGGCAAAARAGAEKARGVVVRAGVSRRQRVQRLRQLSAARALSIADYFSVSPPGAAEPAAGIKPGIAEASAALHRCDLARRPKPPPQHISKRPTPAAQPDAPPPGKANGPSAAPF